MVLSEKNDVDYVIIGGDLNTDISRSASLHTQCLQEFTHNNHFKIASDQTNSQVDYTVI